MNDYASYFLAKARIGTNDDAHASARYPQAWTLDDHDGNRFYYEPPPGPVARFVLWAMGAFSTDNHDALVYGDPESGFYVELED